ncbi:hypothetical protein BCR34DRAFT_595948 [Clohesyomyces aquaticus]|uniref:Metalloendopeptidase n=1 Tax=Clohesyomyces aquaticus TaxID=1231657 RepID=A0A1Y2A867_9PLEO|nr:hypothetical protein BCR34DRAFT_595948 [Clohesyomyces aquaticus]
MFQASVIALSLLVFLASSTLIASNGTNSTVLNLTTIEIQISPGIIYINSSDGINCTIPPVTQRVSYYVEDGIAIIDGDVIFGTEADLLSHSTSNNQRRDDSRQHEKRSLSIFPWTANRWPGGVVTYKWESQAAANGIPKNAKNTRLVDWTEAMKRWTDRLPFLKFVEVGISATLVLNTITLKAASGTGSCTSPVGMATTDNQGAAGNFIKLDNCGAGGYAHEIGHTLGLYHEQQRPDRDSYLRLRCENLVDDNDGVAPKCGENNCAGVGCNFRMNKVGESYWGGTYDVLSLMQYDMYAFSKNKKPTLDPLPGVPKPKQGEFPTLTDARRICDIYWESCPGVCGDGILSPNNGEECDDGNNVDGDGCSTNCKLEKPRCGDGILSPNNGEECDDGNNVDGDGCSANCKIEKPIATTCSVQTCNPTVRLNGCDITTSCITLDGATRGGSGQHMCACRHGFRASGAAANDKSVQARLPWVGQEGRVFVKPGVACNILCDHFQLGRDGCKEVEQVDVCY